MKSVIIAFSNPLLTNWITTVLTRGGYTIEYTFKTAADVVRVADFCTSPVVVSGFQLADMTAEHLMSLLDGRLAMVSVVLPHQQDLVTRKDLAVLPYPLSPVDLLQTIESVERTAAHQALHVGGGPDMRLLRQERPAEEKLLIVQAKSRLMEAFQMTESQAHRYLQKSSMDRGMKLVDAARMVMDNTLVFSGANGGLHEKAGDYHQTGEA